MTLMIVFPTMPYDCPFCLENDLEYPGNDAYPANCPKCGAVYWTTHLSTNTPTSMLSVLLPQVSLHLLDKLIEKLKAKRDLVEFSPWVFVKSLDWFNDATDKRVQEYLKS